MVTPAKNLWHCFGCGAAGGPIDWVMRYNGVSFRHAVELFREGYRSSSLAAGRRTRRPVEGGQDALSGPKLSDLRTLETPLAYDADEQVLLNQVIDYYHATLKRSPEALAYLERRGLTGQAAQEAIATFKLGFANRTLGLRLPVKCKSDGAIIRTRLQSIGILRESGHEHFNGSLVVPVLDENGNVQEVYGRKITDNLRSGTPTPLSARPASRRLERAGASRDPEIILCEALIDALTFWCAGYRNVTSSYGIEGFTDDHLVRL